MKILGIIQEHDGAAYHRVYLPLMYLPNVDCHLTNVITEEVLDRGFDIVYINRLAPANSIEQIKAWKLKYGFKLVVDIDDYWHLDIHHEFFVYWASNDIAGKIAEYIKEADHIITTHYRLKAEIRKEFGKKLISVLPNAIPREGQFNLTKVESEVTRLFWCGSITHEKDVAILRNPMKRISGLPVRVVLGGYTQSAVWDNIISSFTDGLKMNPIIYPGTSPANYYKIYQDCDIALIPLLDTRFNGMKSNLKVLEAANAGAAVVVSNVDPYKYFPEGLINYVDRQPDWFSHIKSLVKNKTFRIEQGLMLKEYCQTTHNFKKINKERLQICKAII